MAETTNPYLRPDTVTTAQQLRQEYMVLEQIKKQLARAKVGSPEYKKALAAKKATEKRIEDLDKIDNAERSTIANEKTAKERAKLKEDLQRAEDYGTPAEVTKAKTALEKYDGKNPFVSSDGNTELRYGPKGESLVPGTPAYESGSTVRPKVTSSTTSGTTNKPGVSGSGDIQAGPGYKPGGSTGDGGIQAGPGYKPDANKTKTAWIGYLEATFKTLPKEYKAQIDKLFTTAKAENWTEVTFTEALKQTTWWQQTLPSLRSFFIETHDPRNASTFAEKMGIQTANVAASLEKLGIRAQQVDPVTGKVIDNNVTIQGIAMEAVKNGWTDVQMLQHLGDNAQLLFTGGGTIGSSVDNIKKQALNYGITIDNNYLNTIQRSLLDPTDGRDTQYYLNEMKAQAIDLYKPFASSIKEGRSLYEVTNSYRNQMATLLEVDSTNLTWKDLMAKVVDPTTGNARTFADFNKQVKQDPLWQYTKNAKETYSNTALDLMKQFGFMG
jgi:hypothetical protein